MLPRLSTLGSWNRTGAVGRVTVTVQIASAVGIIPVCTDPDAVVSREIGPSRVIHTLRAEGLTIGNLLGALFNLCCLAGIIEIGSRWS